MGTPWEEGEREVREERSNQRSATGKRRDRRPAGAREGVPRALTKVYIVQMRDLTNLRVYEPARIVALHTYHLSRDLPQSEKFGLQSQMRRAAISVVANIAEGHGRGTDGDFERHLRIAAGSLAELEALLHISADLELLDPGRVALLRKECKPLGRMLVALTRTVGKARTS